MTANLSLDELDLLKRLNHPEPIPAEKLDEADRGHAGRLERLGLVRGVRPRPAEACCHYVLSGVGIQRLRSEPWRPPRHA